MDTAELFVTLSGIAAIIWIVWFFFIPEKQLK